MGQLVASRQKATSGMTEIGGGRQFLVFSLADEVFAIDILRIREIIEFGHVTTVPLMPDTVRGVINLRGAVVPVVDLVARFGRGQMQTNRRTCVVILEVGHGDDLQVIGVMVDAVNEVLEIAAADIEPPPAFGTRLRADFISGMGKAGGRFIILLDADRVLSVTEMASLGAALKTSAVDG
ncbi:MAG: chemotaxis protein CheW [Gammaproteobacteria bacterium]|nr:chemotaxis protein CheW [Gammaproteobacteria bacterium]